MNRYERVKCDFFCDESANLGHGKITNECKIFSELFAWFFVGFLFALLKNIMCKVFLHHHGNTNGNRTGKGKENGMKRARAKLNLLHLCKVVVNTTTLVDVSSACNTSARVCTKVLWNRIITMETIYIFHPFSSHSLCLFSIKMAFFYFSPKFLHS